jgi:hypothetical protein
VGAWQTIGSYKSLHSDFLSWRSETVDGRRTEQVGMTHQRVHYSEDVQWRRRIIPESPSHDPQRRTEGSGASVPMASWSS